MTDFLSLDDESRPPGHDNPIDFYHKALQAQNSRWRIFFPLPITSQSVRTANEWLDLHPGRSVTARGIHLPLFFLQTPSTSNTLLNQHPSRTFSAPTRLLTESRQKAHVVCTTTTATITATDNATNTPTTDPHHQNSDQKKEETVKDLKLETKLVSKTEMETPRTITTPRARSITRTRTRTRLRMRRMKRKRKPKRVCSPLSRSCSPCPVFS
ncbi:hypothetical protein F4703DRAFT_1848400 [Phycomyces blakesleeanus]